MTIITQEDISLLWNDMQVRSWEELEVLLLNRREKLGEEKKSTLLEVVRELKDEPFPQSEIELYAVLNLEVSTSPQKIWINEI